MVYFISQAVPFFSPFREHFDVQLDYINSDSKLSLIKRVDFDVKEKPEILGSWKIGMGVAQNLKLHQIFLSMCGIFLQTCVYDDNFVNCQYIIISACAFFSAGTSRVY